MSVRIQVIMDESDAASFRAQARKEGKSLSAWLRDSGRSLMHQQNATASLKDPDGLKRFFQSCNLKEKGHESEWDDLKRLISDGARPGGNQ